MYFLSTCNYFIGWSHHEIDNKKTYTEKKAAYSMSDSITIYHTLPHSIIRILLPVLDNAQKQET